MIFILQLSDCRGASTSIAIVLAGAAEAHPRALRRSFMSEKSQSRFRSRMSVVARVLSEGRSYVRNSSVAAVDASFSAKKPRRQTHPPRNPTEVDKVLPPRLSDCC